MLLSNWSAAPQPNTPLVSLMNKKDEEIQRKLAELESAVLKENSYASLNH